MKRADAGVVVYPEMNYPCTRPVPMADLSNYTVTMQLSARSISVSCWKQKLVFFYRSSHKKDSTRLGPQAACMEFADMFSQSYVFQFVHVTSTADHSSTTTRYAYGCAPSLAVIRAFLSSPDMKLLGKCPLFEVIRSSRKCKLYFDIDYVLESTVQVSKEQENSMVAQLQSRTSDLLKSYGVSDAFSTRLLVKERHSALPTGKFKYSWHLIAPYVIVNSNHDGLMRELASELDEVLKVDFHTITNSGAVLAPSEVASAVDLVVYTPNRLLCCLGCTKFGRSIQEHAEKKKMAICLNSYASQLPSDEQFEHAWVGIPESMDTNGFYCLKGAKARDGQQEARVQQYISAYIPPKSHPNLPISEFNLVMRWVRSFYSFRRSRYGLTAEELEVGPMIVRGHTVYVSASNDTYCEVKSRVHKGGRNNQTTYEVNLLTSEVRQNCFSCPINGSRHRMSRVESFDLYKFLLEGHDVMIAQAIKEEFEDNLILAIMNGVRPKVYIWDQQVAGNGFYNNVCTDASLWVQGDIGYLKVGIVLPWLQRKLQLVTSANKTHSDRMKHIEKASKKLLNNSKINGVLELCRQMLGARAARSMEFQNRLNKAHTWIITTKSSRLLDLETLSVTPGVPEAYFSLASNFEMLDMKIPSERARVEKYDKFILVIMGGDTQKRDYLQKIDGYSLTTDHKDRRFYTHVGSGANGKTTHDDAVSRAMGEFHKVVRSGFVGKKKDTDSSKCSPDIVALENARYITCNETSFAMTMDDSRYVLLLVLLKYFGG